jgi:hypothetical protein
LDGGTAATLRIVTPAQGAVVSGILTVAVEASSEIARVELYVDGRLTAESTTPPHQFSWDSSAHENPLPAADHEMDFGYYFVDGRYGDFRAEVNPYTNLYYAWVWRNYPTDQPWEPPFRVSLQNAHREGRRIHLNLQDEAYWDAALDIAAPYWEDIARIELADEPPWDRAETEAVLRRLRQKLSARGLAPRPLGIVYTHSQVLNGDGLFAAGLDWVGIEAYVDPPGSSISQENVDALTAYVRRAKNRVPGDKKIVLIMMAYDRNGAWRNLETLIDLQVPAYLLAHDDPRVIAITMFSYGPPGGTHDHPELSRPHMQIAERILGISVPALGDGPKTLEVRGYGGGRTVSATAQVTVRSQ